MQNIFIVQYARGKDDSYKIFVHAVVLTWEEAKKINDDLILSWKIKSDLLPPLQWPKDKNMDIPLENRTQDEIKYLKWREDVLYAKDFKELPIEKYEIGKIYEYPIKY